MGFFIMSMLAILAVASVAIVGGIAPDRNNPPRNARRPPSGSSGHDVMNADRYLQDVRAAAARPGAFLAQADADPHAGHVLDNVELDGISDDAAEALRRLSPSGERKIAYFVAQDVEAC